MISSISSTFKLPAFQQQQFWKLLNAPLIIC